jgi:hypothetical protein
MSKQVRENFVQLLEEKKLAIAIEPNELEVYVEVAALRDYWHDIGNPSLYTEETHARRKEVLISILKYFNLPASTLDDHDFFWTTTKREKLRSPSRWSEQKLKQAGAGLEKLIEVKWAFNAKPDILLSSPKTALFVEAKLESGEGKNDESGYKQSETLKLITHLSKLLIPEFAKKELNIMTLELKPTTIDVARGITWKDIISLVENSDVDSFTRDCLSQLQRYSD